MGLQTGCKLLVILSVIVSTCKAIGCVDTISIDDCEFIRDNNWCAEDVNELKGKCDRTCGWCTDDDRCVDSAIYIDCPSLSIEECNKDVEFYLSRCRRSCNWCSRSPQGVWQSWSSWSTCSRTCGFGVHSRRRKCLTGSCDGLEIESDVCITLECPSWSEWSSWNSCSSTCEGGKRFRSRICTNGGGRNGWCDGESSDIGNCNEHPCSEVAFNVWTRCSRSCGGGTRYLVRSCFSNNIETCPRTYEDCSTFPCPRRDCNAHRYGSDSECCTYKKTKCGEDLGVTNRIFGGEISSARQFPWMARLEVRHISGSQRHKCGGTLVHQQYVITAAHCVTEWKESDLVVVLGSTAREDRSSFVQRLLVSTIFRHPNFSDPTNDIAILKLKTKAAFTDRVGVLCLPNGEEPPVDSNCYIAGWGLTNPFSSNVSVVLMEGAVRHLPFGVCKAGYAFTGYARFMNEKIMMCAGKISGNVDTCRGDSGGPLMCQRCSSCSWYLAGVTSFGAFRCGTRRRPGVYARVHAFEDWIKSIIPPVENSRYACP